MLQKLKQEWTLFLVAVGFFTRIPVPKSIFVDQNKLNRASRYFALVGLCVGVISAITLAFFVQFLPASIAVLLSMIASVLLTGAFHEDGLADTADGFGGGWTVADKLKIMKDSRLGSYGAIALILALLLKWQLLTTLASSHIIKAVATLLLAHTLSRVVAASFIFTERYVRDTEGKSKPLATKQTKSDLWFLLTSGLIVVAFFPWSQMIILALVLLLLRLLLVHFFERQIGGYTGDTLGAVQQISEIVIYLTLVANM